MMKRNPKKKKVQALTKQMKDKQGTKKAKRKKLDGNTEKMLSTGSTLLDLAISGTRKHGGGIPGGIFVEIFGPEGSGKTVMLCEIAGSAQRQGGSVMFKDPEARLNKQFASMFDLKVDEIELDQPDTVPEAFAPIRDWQPETDEALNVICADSLAALSTNLEMSKDEGDKMGMRRAKEFSEQLRKTCRILAQRNMTMVASNQMRVNADANMFEEKTTAPGGKAIAYYASLRIRVSKGRKLKVKKTIKGKEVTKVIGITTTMECYKNSCDVPFRKADITIIFDYGIDDIRENLIYVKRYTGSKIYTLNGENLNNSLEKSISMIEDMGKEGIDALREEVIELWKEIESKFESNRKKKIR